jgi:dolichol kinase
VVWTESFDAVFLGIMIGAFVVLLICTYLFYPSLFTNGVFWLYQLPKLVVMMAVSCIGGALCRQFCDVDPDGYCHNRTGDKKSKFRVNYTRKLQHFAAYAVPLFVKSGVTGTLALCWGDWFTLVGFLVMIKPIRESQNCIGRFFMLQFNSLDRPEDRPNTIKWIVGGNIIPGLIMIILFRHLYAATGQESFAFIWIFVTGIGDGLAEPVGIAWGRHKYVTRAFGGDKYYTRSLEGSACVFISSLIFTAMYWYVFKNAYQFWTCMVLMPPLMTYAEAVSPHTMDTPFLMGLGGILCLAISHVHVSFY